MKITRALARLMLEVSLRSACDGVDDDDVDAVGAHQHVGDFQTLLAGVRLRDQHIADIDAELFGIGRIERVFGVDVGGHTAELLHLRHHLQAQGGLAGGFRAVDLDHAAARQAADAQGHVQRQRAGGDDIDIARRIVGTHAHDGALAELALDLPQGRIQRLAPIVVHGNRLLCCR